jgi:hypothetical protein
MENLQVLLKNTLRIKEMLHHSAVVVYQNTVVITSKLAIVSLVTFAAGHVVL